MVLMLINNNCRNDKTGVMYPISAWTRKLQLEAVDRSDDQKQRAIDSLLNVETVRVDCKVQT